MENTLYDVAVIGGGPAGAAFSVYARRKGLNVIVFEKEKFPRDHVGESLIPFTYWKLKELDILDDMKAYATNKPGVNFVDQDGKKQSTWCFGKVLDDGSQMTFHTLRSLFDNTILNKAKQSGALVHEEHTVKEVNTDTPDGNVVLKVESKTGGARTVNAKFLIDASGQGSFMGRKLNSKIPYKGLDRVAFFCHWINTDYDSALNQGLIKIIYLGGDKRGWIWVIPVGRNHLSIGVTLNNEYVRSEKKKFEGSENWVKDFYLQELSYAPHLKEILSKASMEHHVISIGDYSYYIEQKFGKNYAMIGDAGAFLDPIFSSGIYVALETASRVCKGVHATLTEGYDKGKAVFEKEFEQINGGYKLIEKFVRLFYTPELLNFAKVNPSNVKTYESSLKAYNVFHYLLAGDFFENHKIYNEFLDSIKSEKAYNRFVHFVQERANETDLSQDCGSTFEEIYGHLPPGDRVAEVKG